MKRSSSDLIPASVSSVHAGEEAFHFLKDQLDALPAESVRVANLDLRAAATVALGVARFVEQPAVHARFMALPHDEFDAIHLRQLAPAAWAVLHAHTRFLSATAAASEARVPEALVREATETRARMLTVLAYHVDEAVELDSIRQGTGHADLATDLTRLAALYDKHHDVIESDRRLFRSTDARHAGDLAARILTALGTVPRGEARDWSDAQNRAWTVLQKHYAEIRDAGLWIFRRDADAETHFPSLPRAVRGGRRRTPSDRPTTPTAASDPPTALPVEASQALATPAV